MKTIKILAAFGLFTVLNGCNNYLEKTPLDSVNTSNYYQTASDAIYAINAAYQPLQRPKLYNFRIWVTDIIAGNSIVGAGGGTDGIETVNQSNFVTTSANAGVLDVYRGPAPGILQCNLVLQRVPAIKMDETLKNRILGEAKFLRALYYFNLVRLFGDIPLITTPLTVGDNLKLPRTPKAQVYDLIIKDLTEAQTVLPLPGTYAGSDIGRATQGSAATLLAKVHLTLGNWSDAAALCAKVKTMGYKLNPNYADNWSVAKKNGIESIFEVQYSGNTAYGLFDDFNQASWLSTFTGPRGANFVGGGYGWCQPTEEFVNNYEAGDKRKDLTVLYSGCPPFDGKVYNGSYSTTGYNLRKFLVPYSISPDANTSPADFIVLRYADVLLMEAEALNELGRTAEAETDINLVRARAGLPPVRTGMPMDVFRKTVLNERRMELAFEGHRWFDLIRVNNGQYGLDFLHSIGKTNAQAFHLLFPIPQLEIDANPNLVQNPGY